VCVYSDAYSEGEGMEGEEERGGRRGEGTLDRGIFIRNKMSVYANIAVFFSPVYQNLLEVYRFFWQVLVHRGKKTAGFSYTTKLLQ
jgi:hypothetical protein